MLYDTQPRDFEDAHAGHAGPARWVRYGRGLISAALVLPRRLLRLGLVHLAARPKVRRHAVSLAERLGVYRPLCAVFTRWIAPVENPDASPIPAGPAFSAAGRAAYAELLRAFAMPERDTRRARSVRSGRAKSARTGPGNAG